MLPVLRGICGAVVVVWSAMALPLSAQEAAGAAAEEASAPPVPATTGQVYRTVDAQGRVIFTDAPPAGRQAEEVRIHSTNTVPMTPRADGALKPSQPVAAQGYQRFVITSPANETVLGQDTDEITLAAELDPALERGHRLQFFVDGQPLGEPDTRMEYLLKGLERGTHTVEARIFNSDGVQLLVTDSIQFHVRRISALNKISAADKGKDDEKKGWLRQLWGRGATAPADMEPVGGYGGPKGVGSLAGAGKPGGAGSPQDVGSLGPK